MRGPGHLYDALQVSGQREVRRHHDGRLLTVPGLLQLLQHAGQVEHVDRELVAGGGEVVAELGGAAVSRVLGVQRQALDQLGLGLDVGQQPAPGPGPRVCPLADTEHLDAAVLVAHHQQLHLAPVIEHHLGLACAAAALQLQLLALAGGDAVSHHLAWVHGIDILPRSAVSTHRPRR